MAKQHITVVTGERLDYDFSQRELDEFLAGLAKKGSYVKLSDNSVWVSDLNLAKKSAHYAQIEDLED